MRRVAILVVGACASRAHDSSNDPPPDASVPTAQTITVTWAFYPILGDPELVGTCRAGVANVELHTSANTLVSLPCDATRSGQISVPLGARVLVRLVDASGATVAESPPELPQPIVRVAFYEDAGYARTLWHVHDAGGPQHPRCAEVFEPLRLTVTDASNAQVLSRAYPCPGPAGTFEFLSDPIREGMYTFTFTGLEGSTSVMAPIGRNNALTDLDVTTP